MRDNRKSGTGAVIHEGLRTVDTRLVIVGSANLSLEKRRINGIQHETRPASWAGVSGAVDHDPDKRHIRAPVFGLKGEDLVSWL